jgi:beta-lactamase superfamily II metal-dependent hydrolase
MAGLKRSLTYLVVWLALMARPMWAFTPSGLLEIHYINVGWGTSVLVIGPDGTRMLMDGGRENMGYSHVVPYMESLGLMPYDGLNYILASHLHSDHINGLTEVMNSGYDVSAAVYFNGSNYSNSYVNAFLAAASRTSAGPAQAIPLGTVIQLGDSATATCVCVNGYVIGHGFVPGSHDDENDRCDGVLIKYGQFEYLFAGDLGGGEGDYNCTHRSTTQVNVETNLARAIMPGGEHPLLTADGVEILHVNHHGSESSTNSDYMNLLTPTVACIATGSGQSPDYMFPRHDVVDNVLLAGVYCITAPSAIVLQSEEGYPTGSQTSYSGYCVGDIVITTSGVANFTVSADGQVTEGPDERAAAGLPLTIPFDGVPPDTVPPVVSVTSPNGGEEWAAGSWHNITWDAFDTVGVAYYAIDFSSDGGADWISVQERIHGNPEIYGWSLPQTTSDNCLIKVTAWDAAGNFASDSSNGIFSIISSQDTIPPTITLVSPDGGELWYSGDTNSIQWTASDNIGIASYSVGYTSDNGTSWVTLRARTPGNPQSMPWIIPNITSNNCRVKVTVWDDLQNQAVDISDTTFRITYRDNQGPNVTIILPAGGEIWTAGSDRYIFWSASDTSGVDSVSLQYSIDAGLSWQVIFPYIHDSPGYYLWNVPDSRSRQALVRAVSKDIYGNIGYGVSAGFFTIRKSPVFDRSVRLSPLAR